MTAFKLSERASGVLLHPTSLPGAHGNGDLGASARRFVEFLAAAGQRVWQMLPVAPTGYGNSPYSAESAFAGSPLLLDLDALATRGWLSPEAVAGASGGLSVDRVDYEQARGRRDKLVRAAFDAFQREPRSSSEQRRFAAFREEQSAWLDDFTLFRALKQAYGGVEWTRWEPAYRKRESAALQGARQRFSNDVTFFAFEQYLFDAQWTALRAFAREKGVALVGDAPIFVAHDSADVWQRPELFHLDGEGVPTVIAGVPPDYFSKTGQRWGNPLYRWKRLRTTGYAWWVARLRLLMARFDAVRLDHFIGFQRYWEIPASEPTAVRGRWVKGPGADFFRVLERELGALPLIAEDLGVVTRKVKALRDEFHLPGIRVLQFAFGNDPSAPDFRPHNYRRHSVVYTGTHDNDTTLGWFHEPGGERSTRTPAQAQKERETAMRYLASDGRQIHWDMIRAASASVARLAIFPMQDLLGLGTEARMNTPGTATGNWEWRFRAETLTTELVAKLREMTETYDRVHKAETRT